LTLYRKSTAHTNDEHWLGDYEVLGMIPPPNEGYVSLLVVVTRTFSLRARERPAFVRGNPPNKVKQQITRKRVSSHENPFLLL
jgi:hypothetical protein